jgi:riboflavin kinase/FMN adenylyltransferase
MDSLSSTVDLPGKYFETAVSIGKFDGLHLGHQALLSRLLQISKELGLSPVVVTFDRHPDVLLRPEKAKLPLVGPNQKRQLLEKLGVALTLTLEFNAELAALTPREFARNILVDGLKAKTVLVGSGFRFGVQGSGDVSTLRDLGLEFGFSVQEIEPVSFEGRAVSTTWIRDLMDSGDIAKANALLGRNHTVTGMVEHGLKIGRQIGFPTANISRDAEGYLPLDGVYAGWLHDGDDRYMAAMSVGINETFQAVPRLVEAHILDESTIDLYDRIVTLEFVDFIRPAAKFAGVEDLVMEINKDLDKIRQRLNESEKRK